MKKVMRLWGVAAALLMAAGAMTACSSDNDDKDKTDSRVVTEGDKTGVPESQLTDEERYQLDAQKAVTCVMEQLAGLSSVTPDVTNRTYEPTYGVQLDGATSTVRAAKCESTEDAEQLFRSICGISSTTSTRLVTTTSDGYEVSLRNLPILPDGKTFTLGTLTFHRDASARRYGYVEVSIACIPHLERIDFLSATAFPDNAGGESAYKPGDVVYYNGNTYCKGYYLCLTNNDYGSGWLVHMSVGDMGAGETVNLDGDSEGCFYPYNQDRDQRTNFDIVNTYCRFITLHQEQVAAIKAFMKGELADQQPTEKNKLWHIFPEGFDNDRTLPFVSPDGRDAAIWYTARMTGDYAWVPPYNYRQASYGLVKSGLDRVSDESFRYVRDNEWNNQWSKNWNFCMNTISFDRDGIVGARVEFSPGED